MSLNERSPDAPGDGLKVYAVLFLCAHNAARSIMAESILTAESHGRFRAYSAGVEPAAEIDPDVLALLRRDRMTVPTTVPKSWNVFAGPTAPTMDFIFTLCDRTAATPPPPWPGDPMTATWAVPDPLEFSGTATDRALHMASVFRMLWNRIAVFSQLSLGSLDRLTLQGHLHRIGHSSEFPAANGAVRPLPAAPDLP